MQVWATKPSTTKLMAFKVDDWTHEGEDVFVDVRAKVNDHTSLFEELDDIAILHQE